MDTIHKADEKALSEEPLEKTNDPKFDHPGFARMDPNWL